MEHTDREDNISDIGKATCPFLRLPTEVREMIYHHHLTSKRIVPRHPALTKRWTPIDLLYVNRTIYNEAFFHLYTRGDFVLAVRPESIFGLSTCWGTNDVSPGIALEFFLKSQKTVNVIRHIDVQIHWPSIEYCKLMDRGSSLEAPSTDKMLKQTMTTVGAMLAELPCLRSIDVSWYHMTVSVSEATKAAPPTYRIPVWLRGLKQVRRKNEKVDIRMPLKGPISTKELAEEQKDRGEFLNVLREVRENLLDIQGDLTEGFF